MWKHEDPEGDPRWLNTAFAIAGITFVATLLINFWIAVSTLLG